MEPRSDARALAGALGVIADCKTGSGFKASTQAYPELWLRDLVYSEGPLLDLGHAATVRAHFESMLRLQRRSGQVPTAVGSGLRRIFNQRFHFWTSDTEVLFLAGVARYSSATGDRGLEDGHRGGLDSAVRYVEGRTDSHGLLPGMDWRDALMCCEGRFLLSNQANLVAMYDALGLPEEAEKVRLSVRELFFDEALGYYADAVWWSDGAVMRDLRFDCLGNALSMLTGITPVEQVPGVCDRFRGAETRFGLRDFYPPCPPMRARAFRSFGEMNAFARNGAFLRNREGHYQNSAIWPFVEAKVAEALTKAGRREQAVRIAELALGRRGFSEWYSPSDGAPKGSEGQLWTAAGLLSMSRVLGRPLAQVESDVSNKSPSDA